jgi:hypothetical protein
MTGRIETWLDEERRFIRQRVDGDIDLDDFERMVDDTQRLAKELRDPARPGILLDARGAQKASFRARRAMVQQLGEPTLPRIAFWGATPVARVLARFMIAFAGIKKVRMFEREDEAIDWLLS